MATAFWVVYITRVIEPRWKKAANNAPGNNRAPRQLWLNRELAALLFLLVLALGLAAFLPTSGQGTYFTTSQYKHMVWGFVALFMALLGDQITGHTSSNRYAVCSSRNPSGQNELGFDRRRHSHALASAR